MSRRVVAVVMWMVAAYFLYGAVAWAVFIVKSLMSPWMGPEPELMIPLIPLAIAIGFALLGRRLWRQSPTRSLDA